MNYTLELINVRIGSMDFTALAASVGFNPKPCWVKINM